MDVRRARRIHGARLIIPRPAHRRRASHPGGLDDREPET